MAAKDDLKHTMLRVMRDNKDGSHGVQASRRNILCQIVNTLASVGYKLRHVQGLKLKHILYLNQLSQQQGLNSGTIKNRNAALRWVCRKLN